MNSTSSDPMNRVLEFVLPPVAMMGVIIIGKKLEVFLMSE